MEAVQQKLGKLLRRPLFSAAEARERGVHPSLLAYYCKRGLLERVSRGYYRSPNYVPEVPFEWEDAAYALESIPEGVLCLLSALQFYELSDEMPRKIWIAVPRSSWPPRRMNCRIVRMHNMSLGKTTVEIGEFKLPIFNRERCIVDAFRLLSKEVALKALKQYLQPGAATAPRLSLLSRYAKAQRVDIQPYIEALTI